MSKRIKKHLPLLKLLKKANQEERRALIENASDDFILTLTECVVNLLKGNVECSHTSRTKLKRSAPVLREIANRKNSDQAKTSTINSRRWISSSVISPRYRHSKRLDR